MWKQHGQAAKNRKAKASCVTLGKLLKLSVPLFPNLENEDGTCTYLREAVRRTNKSMCAKHLE